MPTAAVGQGRSELDRGSAGRVAAVDHQFGARHERGFVRAEKDDRRGDVLSRSHASKRVQRRQRVADRVLAGLGGRHSLDRRLDHRRPGEPGVN